MLPKVELHPRGSGRGDPEGLAFGLAEHDVLGPGNVGADEQRQDPRHVGVGGLDGAVRKEPALLDL